MMQPIDHDFVLRNPQYDWPADMVAEARQRRDAELAAIARVAGVSSAPSDFDRAVLRAPVRPVDAHRHVPAAARIAGALLGAAIVLSAAWTWGL